MKYNHPINKAMNDVHTHIIGILINIKNQNHDNDMYLMRKQSPIAIKLRCNVLL